MSDYLPEELLEKILIRVPIKPLLRFTTVCKRWYILISTPQFIHAHLNFTKLEISNTRILIVFSKMEVKNGKTNLKRNYIVCSDNNDGSLKGSVRFAFPRDGFVENLHIVGCVNGLVCLPVIRVNSRSGSVDPQQVVMLWNPLIRRFLHLPNSDKESRFGKCFYTFGFVFDCVTNDYKVLRVYSGLRDHPDVIEIFRLSTGLWEDIVDTPPFGHISRRSPQADLDGIAHWIGKDSKGKVKIISFDTFEEVFSIIDLPVKQGNVDEVFDYDLETYLFVYDKSLFFIELVDTREVYDQYDPYYMGSNKSKYCIWRMKEYVIVESWTQVRNCVFDISVHPLGFRMNGEILWAGRNGELISTNLEGGKQKYIRTYEKGTCFSSCSYYVESLVLLDETKSNRVRVSTIEGSSGKQLVLESDEVAGGIPSPTMLEQ